MAKGAPAAKAKPAAAPAKGKDKAPDPAGGEAAPSAAAGGGANPQTKQEVIAAVSLDGLPQWGLGEAWAGWSAKDWKHV